MFYICVHKTGLIGEHVLISQNVNYLAGVPSVARPQLNAFLRISGNLTNVWPIISPDSFRNVSIGLFIAEQLQLDPRYKIIHR